MQRFVLFVVLLVAALAGVGYMLSPEFRVERSIAINSDPETIHALVGDLKRWPEWSPWEEEDPTIVVQIAGRSTGIGARQTWVGDGGSGELVFTSASEERGIEYAMSFDGGKWRSHGALKYRVDGSATRVVWVMDGDMGSNIIGRYFALAMDFMVGPTFERGLQKLKVASENGR